MSERLTEEGPITDADKAIYYRGKWRCERDNRDRLESEITRLVARVGELEGELERFSSGTREHDPNAFYLKTTSTNPPAAQALANGEQAR